MVLSSFSGNSLLAQGGGFQPQTKSSFAILVYGVGDQDTLALSIKSTDIPAAAFVRGKVKFWNETMHYAASVQPFAEAQIAFNDYVDRATFQILSAWHAMVWNPATGAMGWARDYKKTADINLLPSGMPGAAAVTSAPYNNRVWHMTGVFPLSLKHETFDMNDDGSSPILINLVLNVDRAYPAFMV
jgi:hypothetical protein